MYGGCGGGWSGGGDGKSEVPEKSLVGYIDLCGIVASPMLPGG